MCIEIYPVLVRNIYTYIQQVVLTTKSSPIKVPSQVSLIHCLVFKQLETIWLLTLKHHRHSSASTKVGFFKQSYDSDVPNETYSPLSPIPKHLGFTFF